MPNTTLSQAVAADGAARYEHLSPKPGSNYRQLFAAGRIRADVLYRETIGDAPLSPEQVAEEYGLGVEAVLEAIDYCTRNPKLLDEDRTRESARITAASRDRWPYAPRTSETTSGESGK